MSKKGVVKIQCSMCGKKIEITKEENNARFSSRYYRNPNTGAKFRGNRIAVEKYICPQCRDKKLKNAFEYLSSSDYIEKRIAVIERDDEYKRILAKRTEMMAIQGK
jgi:predicted RNA-binding Zn-ribbon protein involved in translation (DUF1610 family)